MFNNWKKSEIAWLILANTIILALSIYWGDTPIGIISAITGVTCVILTAKGSIYCYFWGLINCLAYSYIGYINQYYGEFILNLLYYAPLQVVGYIIWKKNMNEETDTVNSRKMSNKSKLKLLGVVVIGIIIVGKCLESVGGNLPYIDATTNVLSWIAMIVSIKRYAEQWILWIIINTISVGMWAVAMSNGSDNIATLLMWAVYLVNSVYGYYTWSKKSKIFDNFGDSEEA